MSQSPTSTEPFPSLAALRAAHAELLKMIRETRSLPSSFAPIIEFLARGVATGVYLSDEDDRSTAQSQLDYWSAMMYRTGQEPPDTTLAEFDVALEPMLDESLCPYVGVVPFSEEQKQFFFGRRALINEFLIKRLEATRLMALLGPTGSGKSSVLQAGLIPALKEGGAPETSLEGSKEWRYLPTITPGSDPLNQLARLLPPDPERVSQLRERPQLLAETIAAASDVPAVLLVDQFDELFTETHDEKEQEAFVAALVALADAPGPRHTVLIGMRSDVESQIARFPGLQEWFKRGRFQLLPLSGSELRDAIEKPAELVGLKFEPGLVDKLIEDLLGEPAALPLLQFTLLELWEHRDHTRITWDAYNQYGSGRQALARCAETFYTTLNPADREMARRVLLRLVRIERGMDVVTQRVQRAVLVSTMREGERANRILTGLEEERLIRIRPGHTPDEDQIELAHDALVRNWPRMVDWLESQRVSLETRRRLEVRAMEWAQHGHETVGLLDAIHLVEAEAWLESPEALALGYDPEIPALVAASRTAIEEATQRELRRERLRTEAAEKLAEAERQRAEQASQLREVERARAETANQLAEAERQRAKQETTLRQRLGIALIALAIALGAAVIFAGYAFQQTSVARDREREASQQRNELQTQTVKLTEAENTAREEAAAAQAAQQEAEAQRQVAEEQRQVAETQRQEADAQRQAAEEQRQEAEKRALEAKAGELAASALARRDTSPQAALLLAAESLRISAAANQAPLPIALNTMKELLIYVTGRGFYGHTAPAVAVAFDPSRNRLITGDTGGQLLFRDTTQLGQAPDAYSGGATLRFMALSADSRFLATAGTEGTSLRLWSLDGTPTPQSLTVDAEIVGIALSNDGRWLVVATKSGAVAVYSTENPTAAPQRLSDTQSPATSLALHPNGTLLLVGHEDGQARLWNLSTRRVTKPDPIAGRPAVTSVAISPSGSWALIGYATGRTDLWPMSNTNFASSAPSVFRGQTGAISIITVSPKGDKVATTSADGSTYLWALQTRNDPPSLSVFRGHTETVNAVAINQDGTQLVTVSDDQTVRIWDLNDPSQSERVLRGHDAPVRSVAFSPDKTLLATVSDDMSLRIWDLTSSGQDAGDLPDDPAALIDQACQIVGRNIGEQDRESGSPMPDAPICPNYP